MKQKRRCQKIRNDVTKLPWKQMHTKSTFAVSLKPDVGTEGKRLFQLCKKSMKVKYHFILKPPQ